MDAADPVAADLLVAGKLVAELSARKCPNQKQRSFAAVISVERFDRDPIREGGRWRVAAKSGVTVDLDGFGSGGFYGMWACVIAVASESNAFPQRHIRLAFGIESREAISHDRGGRNRRAIYGFTVARLIAKDQANPSGRRFQIIQAAEGQSRGRRPEAADMLGLEGEKIRTRWVKPWL